MAEVDRPVATAHKRSWLGLIWLVPVAALLIVGYLGIRSFFTRGTDVIVTFDEAPGIRESDTKVTYRGLEVGEVTRVAVNQDGRRIDATLRVSPRAEAALNADTQFWLVGASPNLGDIASLKAALAGVTITMSSSGGSGRAKTHYDGLSEPPIVSGDTAGTMYHLRCKDIGSIRKGSSVYYHGQEIGKTTAVTFVDARKFQVDIFVLAPFDKMVRPGSRFWEATPLRVDLTDSGLNANLAHASSLLNGGLELGLPPSALSESQSPAGTEYILYPDRDEAFAGPTEPEVRYQFKFDGSVGELAVGAAVRLRGFRVGIVKAVKLQIDPVSGEVGSEVVAALYPLRLQVHGPMETLTPEAWRAPMDAAVRRWIAQGYRAQLVQKPPLIGGYGISLEKGRGAPAAALTGDPPLIPSAGAVGNVDAMMAQINQLLVKLNQIPIEAIGRDVKGITAQLERVLGEVKPQIGPLLQQLKQTANELTQTAAAARGVMSGQGGKDASLPDAVQQLTDAARSIRSLADYLGRHPEALIRGKRKEDP